MKTPARIASFLIPILGAVAAEPVTFQVVVTGIPTQSSEVVLVLDTAAAPPPNYDDAAPPPVPAPVRVQKVEPQIAPAAADPAAPPAPAVGEEPPRRRRRFAGAGAVAAPVAAAIRESVDPKGGTTATLRATVPPGENYQARIVALRGDDQFPTVLAGGRIDGLKIAAGASTQTLVLKSPALRISPENSTIVAAGSRFHLTGTITDVAHSLGTKNRMRVWISEDTPPAANFAGRQVSTIDVTTKGDDVEFNFELTAPKRATTLFFQFGELPSDFARDDGRQAPFVVLPDLSTGASALQLVVK